MCADIRYAESGVFSAYPLIRYQRYLRFVDISAIKLEGMKTNLIFIKLFITISGV